MPKTLTLDDLFAGVTPTPSLGRTRRQLHYAGIDDIDKLRTFSLAELSNLFAGFGPQTQAKYDEQLRLLGYSFADNALPDHVRCAAVYGVQTMPLEQMSIHSTGTRRQPLIQLILRYAPDTTLGQFDGWYEDDFEQLVNILLVQYDEFAPYEFNSTEVRNLAYAIEEWGQVSIPARWPYLVAV